MAYTTIDNPELYFQTKLYTGNGSTNAITLDGSENMQPDWVWIKERGGAENHNLFDSVRGVTKRIRSNGTEAEDTRSSALTAFGTDGFTLGSDNQTNNNSDTYVAWNWKETATAGFDIVSFTGNATVRTISHSLSAVPKMIIVKNRSNVHDWRVYHASLGATHDIYLSSTGVKNDSTTPWNDTEPTSSVFTVGTANGTNQNGDSLIAYLFAEKQGYSKFGSYTGNNDDDGAFVYTGFKPAFVMVKITAGQTDNWIMQDNKRNTSNLSTSQRLRPNSAGAEFSSSNEIDLLSNGFKCHGADGEINGSGFSYIYMAFAEQPLVTSSGVPATAR